MTVRKMLEIIRVYVMIHGMDRLVCNLDCLREIVVPALVTFGVVAEFERTAAGEKRSGLPGLLDRLRNPLQLFRT